jgi:squalene-associated FAD-dependent desaturase
MTAPDAVVVGGGFAGLSAGAMLAEAGLRVLLLDARPQLGGRATAFPDRATGELVDNGQHVLFGCYHETLAFLRRVGAEGNVRVQPALALPYLDRLGRRTVLRCPPLPAPMHLLAGVLDWDALKWSDRLSVLRMAGPILRARRSIAKHPEAPLAPDSVTVSAWLEAAGQSARLREWLWNPLAVAALNQSPDEAAAAPFVRVLAALFGPDAADSALVLPIRPLHLAYAEPARQFIEARGGAVRTGALARLTRRDGGLHVSVRGEPIARAPVISTVAWSALGDLFGAEPPPALEPIARNAAAMASKPIVTVNLWYESRILDDEFVGLPGRVMQWVFDKSAIVRDSSGASHLSLVSSGADEIVAKSDDELIAGAAQEIAETFQKARGIRLVRATVIREKRATFSLAPGQPPRPGVRTPLPSFYLAGDWTDTGLPGTIESAVVSGHRAAAALLADRTARSVR